MVVIAFIIGWVSRTILQNNFIEGMQPPKSNLTDDINECKEAGPASDYIYKTNCLYSKGYTDKESYYSLWKRL